MNKCFKKHSKILVNRQNRVLYVKNNTKSSNPIFYILHKGKMITYKTFLKTKANITKGGNIQSKFDFIKYQNDIVKKHTIDFIRVYINHINETLEDSLEKIIRTPKFNFQKININSLRKKNEGLNKVIAIKILPSLGTINFLDDKQDLIQKFFKRKQQHINISYTIKGVFQNTNIKNLETYFYKRLDDYIGSFHKYLFGNNKHFVIYYYKDLDIKNILFQNELLRYICNIEIYFETENMIPYEELNEEHKSKPLDSIDKEIINIQVQIIIHMLKHILQKNEIKVFKEFLFLHKNDKQSNRKYYYKYIIDGRQFYILSSKYNVVYNLISYIIHEYNHQDATIPDIIPLFDIKDYDDLYFFASNDYLLSKGYLVLNKNNPIMVSDINKYNVKAFLEDWIQNIIICNKKIVKEVYTFEDINNTIIPGNLFHDINNIIDIIKNYIEMIIMIDQKENSDNITKQKPLPFSFTKQETSMGNVYYIEIQNTIYIHIQIIIDIDKNIYKLNYKYSNYDKLQNLLSHNTIIFNK